MGEIADKMINGKMCACCGVYLEPDEIVFPADDLAISSHQMPSDGSEIGFSVYCIECKWGSQSTSSGAMNKENKP